MPQKILPPFSKQPIEASKEAIQAANINTEQFMKALEVVGIQVTLLSQTL